MEIAIWVVQVVLAFVFLMVGGMKLAMSRQALVQVLGTSRIAYIEDFSDVQVRLIGLAEVLGAVGLVLPSVTGILPILTPVAATGLAIIQIGAFFTHLRRGNEGQMIAANIVLLALLSLGAWGRFGPYSL